MIKPDESIVAGRNGVQVATDPRSDNLVLTVKCWDGFLKLIYKHTSENKLEITIQISYPFLGFPGLRFTGLITTISAYSKLTINLSAI